MKPFISRACFLFWAVFFLSVGAVGGHFEGVALGYERFVGPMESMSEAKVGTTHSIPALPTKVKK